MSESGSRRRAPGMSVERRRDSIVAAALPLLVERGAAVSTQQIARAAGIGEATLFRAFADKQELLTACIAAALRNDHVLADLDAVPLDQPLAARLTEAATILRAYLTWMGAVIGAVHAAGGTRTTRQTPHDKTRAGAAWEESGPEPSRAAAERPRGEENESERMAGARASEKTGHREKADPQAEAAADHRVTNSRAEAVERTRQAVIRLLEPDRAALRLPVEQLAAVFLSMMFARPGPVGGETPLDDLIDVFLHGVLGKA